MRDYCDTEPATTAQSIQTVHIARELNLRVHTHQENLGYDGNQKTCYREALKLDADIVVMMHPDYQYTPKLIPAMASIFFTLSFILWRFYRPPLLSPSPFLQSDLTSSGTTNCGAFC